MVGGHEIESILVCHYEPCTGIKKRGVGTKRLFDWLVELFGEKSTENGPKFVA